MPRRCTGIAVRASADWSKGGACWPPPAEHEEHGLPARASLHLFSAPWLPCQSSAPAGAGAMVTGEDHIPNHHCIAVMA